MPLNGKAVRWKHQHILRQRRPELRNRRQPFGQRVSIGLAVHDRHVRGDARQYLVARNDHAVLVVDHAGMFGRMATAGHYGPVAIANADDCAVIEPVVSARQPRHRAGKIAPAAFAHLLDTLFVITIKFAAKQDFLRRMLPHIGDHQPRQQPFGAVHPHRHFELVGKPPSATDMVGMEMRNKNPGQLAFGQCACKHRFPVFDHVRHEKAGIGNCIAICDFRIIVEQATG